MHRRSFIFGVGALAVAAGAGTAAWRYASGSMVDYAAYQERLRAPLTIEPGVSEIIRHATLAANGHNTQPWMFRIRGDEIELAPDLSRRTPVVDSDDHHLFVSLGCAAENLTLAAKAAGRSGEFTGEPGADGVRFALSTGKADIDPLFEAIGTRQSTRAVFDSRPLAPGEIDLLERQSRVEGVRMVFITAKPEIGKLRDLIIDGNGRQMADPAFVSELKHWLRFNPRSAMASGDGLFAPTSGNPAMPDAVGAIGFGLAFTAASENEKYRAQIDSSSGLVVLLGDRADPAHWIRVGRACQRFGLAATRAGLKTSFVNQPVEVPELRDALAVLVGEPGKRPDIVMRFGRGPSMPYSPRRPVEAVVS